MARSDVQFLRNGVPVALSDIGPTDTLLDYLRLREGACDTKEGCAEGDCGACTVALGSVDPEGKLVYQPVNSCILMLGQVAEKDVITAGDLTSDDGTLHPVQEAMVRHHGSQCGFCTPGIVMSLFTLYHREDGADRAAVDDWLAGNLCRCTGYRPIVDAALESCNGLPSDGVSADCRSRAAALRNLRDGQDILIETDDGFLAAPASESALSALLETHPDATIVAGATDVGLWVTKQLRTLPKTIFVHRIEGFDRVEVVEDRIIIGAGATYAQAEAALSKVDPDLAELVRRIGSKQVRASGTIGGNIANGSPIGDTPPALIALEAELVLRSRAGERRIRLEDFFIDYGKQDLHPGEYVAAIDVPRLTREQHFRCFKISKRFDQDISAAMGGFRFTVSDGKIFAVRIAFGGMAATPKRAVQTEAALVGLDLGTADNWQRVVDTLESDYAPIDDMRASARYRMAAAKGILLKALSEVAGTPSGDTRVIGVRGVREGDDVRAA